MTKNVIITDAVSIVSHSPNICSYSFKKISNQMKYIRNTGAGALEEKFDVIYQKLDKAVFRKVVIV